jgi:hypothetical protein
MCASRSPETIETTFGALLAALQEAGAEDREVLAVLADMLQEDRIRVLPAPLELAA